MATTPSPGPVNPRYLVEFFIQSGQAHARSATCAAALVTALLCKDGKSNPHEIDPKDVKGIKVKGGFLSPVLGSTVVIDFVNKQKRSLRIPSHSSSRMTKELLELGVRTAGQNRGTINLNF